MSDPAIYTIGWICALPIEYLAAQVFLDEEHNGPESVSKQDNNSYTLGKAGKHNVVIVMLSGIGISNATGAIRDLLHSFPNIRIGVMVGVGGGAPSLEHDIRLGDVVVSAASDGKPAVFQYDFGNALQGDMNSFREKGYLNQPPTVVQAAMNGLITQYKRKGHVLAKNIDNILTENPRLEKEFQRPEPKTDRLYQSSKVHPPSHSNCAADCGDDPNDLISRAPRGKYDDDPAIHYGLIASANTIMKDARARDGLIAKKGVLCFEMEAAGLMNQFPFLVIRGICDYSDSHKNKEWQGFAAMMAAAYAKDLLAQIPPNKIEAEKPINEVMVSIKDTLNDMNGTANETKDTVMGIRSHHQSEKLKQWLNPPDCSTNANRARNLHHAGTGTWLLESQGFEEWKRGSRQHLWLHGLSGCGKTILSSTVLDHLEQLGTHTILSFFFDFSDDSKQKLENLLRSLLFQVYLTGAEEATGDIEKLFASHANGEKQPSQKALLDCIHGVLQASKGLLVIIDALDECTTRRQLLDWIRHLASGSTQLILTSRPEAEFKTEMSSVIGQQNCISLDKAAIDSDIRSFVTAKIEKNADFVSKSLSKDLQEEICDKVGNGADGMFRWAACQLDRLAKCPSPYAIKKALRSLPPSLEDTYSRMLQDIDPDLKDDATRLLQFLTHARKPLSLPEAIEVIATQTEQEPYGFRVDRRVFRESLALWYCPGLVSVDNNGSVEWLHLAHFSVKEYLLEQHQYAPQSSSIVITKTCLTYLADINHTNDEDFPLEGYATNNWMKHGSSVKESEEVNQTIVRFLQNETALQRWHRDFQNGPHYSIWSFEPRPTRASGLFYACLGGFTIAARVLLSANTETYAQDGSFDRALQIASHYGHKATVELLLELSSSMDFDANAQNSLISSALAEASGEGHKEVVQMLLAKSTDPSLKDPSALQNASFEGNGEVVELILQSGADPNVQGGFWGNALQTASVSGCTEIVRLLLDYDADPNVQGGFYGGAIQAALAGGYEETTKLLLAKGARVNIKPKDSRHRTPLEMAIRSGKEDMVRLILASGADVNARGGGGGYPLFDALALDNADTVRLLLESGADCDVNNGRCGTALHEASENCYEEAAELLLAYGADSNAKGGHYGYPLIAAAANGHTQIVRLLLANGARFDAIGGEYGSALGAASAQCFEDVVQLLRANGADLTADVDEYGISALHAAYEGSAADNESSEEALG